MINTYYTNIAAFMHRLYMHYYFLKPHKLYDILAIVIPHLTDDKVKLQVK